MAGRDLSSELFSPEGDKSKGRDLSVDLFGQKATGPAKFSLGDIASSFGIGAVGSTKALTDVAGAENVASAKLSQGIQSLQAGMTPERQAELQRQAERMKAAEESGSFLQEVKAAGQNVLEAPLQTAAQAVGSFVPYLPALLASPIAAAIGLTGRALGVITSVAQQAPKYIATAQGLGAVKGSIYEGVYKAEVEAGTSPEIAKQKADASQSYFGDNFEQIALGGALGLVAGSSGVEKLFSPASRAAQQGLARRVAGTTAAESGVEGIQGGQERLAQNIALQRGGFDVDTFKGVAGAATGEALAGALGAAPIAALTSPAQPAATTPSTTPSTAPSTPPSNSPIVGTTQVDVDGVLSTRVTRQDGSQDIDGVQVTPPTVAVTEPQETLTPITPAEQVAEPIDTKIQEVDPADVVTPPVEQAVEPAVTPVVLPDQPQALTAPKITPTTTPEVREEYPSLTKSEVDELGLIPPPKIVKPKEPKVDYFNHPDNIGHDASAKRELDDKGKLAVAPQPVTEGGIPFTSRKSADMARKNYPEMRVLPNKNGKGFILAPKTPKQIAADEAKAKRLGQAKTSATGTPMSAHEYITSEGGLAKTEMSDMNMDKNVRVGNRFLFAGDGKGLTMDPATEKLQQAGYLGENATMNDARKMIADSIKKPQYRPQDVEEMAKRDEEKRFEDYRKAEEEASLYSPVDEELGYEMSDFEGTGYEAADPDVQAEVRALLAQADELGINTESIREEVFYETENQSVQAYYKAFKSALEGAIARGREDSVQDTGEPSDEGATLTLTQPTPQDIIDKQDAAAKAEKQRKDEEKAKEDKAKADEADFTLTGSDREADEAAARGQRDVFETKKEALPKLLPPPNFNLKKGRNEQVVLAARLLDEKKISRDEYDRYVDANTPIATIDIKNMEPPMQEALMKEVLTTKLGKDNKNPEKINAPIADGTPVGLRMDIPALNWGKANNQNGSVVSIHKASDPKNKSSGENLSYKSVGSITDAQFAIRNEKRALSIAKSVEGKEGQKTPQQTIEGKWVNMTPAQVLKKIQDNFSNPEWVQVSMDPLRHSYFYDRATKQPVVSADEVLQVGRFVLAKNVQYAPASEFLYSAEKTTTGFNNTQENLDITKAIDGMSMIQVSKWAVDNAPNAAAKYFAQKVYDRIRQMQANGVMFGFEVLTSESRPKSMKLARGRTQFLWGRKDKGENTTINIVLNGPTVVKNQAFFPPGVEYRTVLHELLHVATRGQMYFLKENDPLVKEVRDLYRKVLANYKEDEKNNNLSGLTKDYSKGINNAFSDPDELVSWGLTDERMQKYMSGIKVGESNAFSKLINLVRRILGLAPPYESALDRLVKTTDELLSVDVEKISESLESQGFSFGPSKSKQIPQKQQSLFSKRVKEVFSNEDNTPSNSADNVMDLLGRKAVPLEPSYKEKIRQSWDNARDNPKLTAEEAGKSVISFLDKIQTKAFSSDAALNNKYRRAIYDSTMAAKDKIGSLLNISQSQVVHADALASLFIYEGNLKYNDELYKWESFKDDNNFIQLSKDIDVIAEKYGKTKAEAEIIAHTAFEAKRLKSMVEFNSQVDREVAKMRVEASSISSSKPVASSALYEKADKRVKDKKFIHKINGQSDLSVEDQIAAGMSLFSLMPELNTAVETWNGIRANTIKILVDSGLWTQAEAEFLMDNADYVPFFREDQLEEGKGPKEYISGLMVQAKEKKLKGSDKPVNDIFNNMIRWTQYSINRAVRNKSAVALSDAALEMGAAKEVKNRSEGKNVVRVWRNGVETFYDMEDPLYMDAFNGIESMAIPVHKWMTTMSNVLRQTVVLYPLFTVAQLPQDSFAAMFTSGLKPRYALTIPARAAKEFLMTLFKQSQTHEQLKKFGVVGVKDFSAAVARLDAEIYAGFKARPGVLGRTKDFLSHIAMSGDNAVRQAVYTASMDQGLSQAEALEKAFEIWNVRRRGSYPTLALAGQVIPFFNAYLAAQNVAYKTITGVGTSPTERENAFKTLIATTASVMTLSLLYAMLNGDDEDYENKPAVVRDRLLMIPGTGGLSIPLRADLFTLPKIITEHTYLLMTDKGYEDGRKFRDSVKAALGSALLSPTVVPQLFKPIVEVGINYNFYSGRPLIGQFEKKKETELQFNNSTSEIAKLLGSTGLVSPIAVDHLMRGMFGSAGGLVIYMTNPVLHSDPNVDRPSLSLREAFATLPGTSGFISKEYESGLKSDFYVLRDEVAKVAATVADMKVVAPDKIEEYLSSEEKMAKYGLSKGINKITDQLGKIRRAITYITNQPSSEMSASEKQEAIKELRETEREILKAINVKELRKMAQI